MTENLEIEIKNNVRKAFHLSENETNDLVWTGTESNTAYKIDEEEIMILTKQGEVKPFSSFLDPAVSISLQRKYFICYPEFEFS